ncbi:hypothetical protein GQ457_03G014240 [Hibiscus cannabinus]
MEDVFVVPGRSRRTVHEVSNLHHFQVELFYQVIDRQLQELNNRFYETSTELLLCVACLSPRDFYIYFDKKKLIRLVQLYPYEFSAGELMLLACQLENYIVDVRSDKRFCDLKGLSDLSEKMVETMKHVVSPLVYLLLKLALVLPVATASMERTFFAIHFIKNRLRNRMGDEWLNEYLVSFIEKDVFDNVDNEKIIQRY